MNGFEFAIPNELLTGPINGLAYSYGQTFPGVGDDVVLRISQSLGYSPVGGASFGTDRLGRVTLQAAATDVPEPASLLLLGVGALASAGLARRRSQSA